MIIVIIVFAGILFLVIRKFKFGKNKELEFKRVDMFKEVKKTFKYLSNTFGIPVKKRLNKDLFDISFIKKAVVIYWDMSVEPEENLKRNIDINQSQTLKEEVSKNPDVTELIILQVCGCGFLNRLFSFHSNNFLCIEKSAITFTNSKIILNSHVTIQPFFEIGIYGEASKDFVENISFRINQENRADEFANIVKKQTYLELSQAKHTEQLDMLNEYLKSSDKERTEQIRKAKV